ncbi:DUF349 domain-containing protein [Pseudactinotalea terrae]|uniref:DUF349 domain-containing protein n=1 Tax=Pseudactinotalea terrae TaxID=1743262 RepID=UPI001F4F2ABE|nr:DUF349 domain-containing protein [Pseudactinotalea terrae]
MSQQPDAQHESLIRSMAGPLPVEPRAVVEAPAQPEPTAQPEPATAPAPAPRPTPAAPKPSAIPRPGPPATPAAVAPAPAAAPAAPAATPAAAGAEAPLDPALVTAAAQFGRVDGEGTVYVADGENERVVGQFPDALAQEAMLLYIRRYLDLEAQVSLFEARLPHLNGRDIDTTVSNLTSQLEEPAAVGDLPGLRARMAALTDKATERKQALAAEREAARAEAMAERTRIVERAEELAAMDPARVQWKTQGEELRTLLETWKTAQRSGVRLDRKQEDALWKRFAKARGTFDRNRRAYFSELDSQHKQARAAKEELIARAEAMQSSTDWGATSAAYRDLMDEWKRSGRASRKDDDALWARFRAAQDVFFEARNAQNAQTDATYAANLEVKNAILVEAEALLPVTDVKSAKAALHKLQDRWEAAGKVPRDAMQRTEARMRAVEQAIRSAEDAQWRSSNPQKRARAEGFAAQLEASIERLEDDLAKAERTGNQSKIKAATEALEAQRTFLDHALRAADDAS